MIDAGIVAPPIEISEDDLLRMSRAEIAELEANAFVPGVTVWRHDDPVHRTITIAFDRPCVTTLPA